MNQINFSTDEWQECAPGELIRFASREKAKVVRRRLIQAGGAVAIVVMAGVFLNLRESSSSEPNYGGIRCSAVRTNANAHLAGRLDKATEAKIAQHLKQCPVCATWMKKAAAEQVSKKDSPDFYYATVVPKELLSIGAE